MVEFNVQDFQSAYADNMVPVRCLPCYTVKPYCTDISTDITDIVFITSLQNELIFIFHESDARLFLSFVNFHVRETHANLLTIRMARFASWQARYAVQIVADGAHSVLQKPVC